jgi:putative endonuclease
MKEYFVYIMCSENLSALYIGVINNLARRIYEHQNELVEGFTKKYKTKRLVHFENYNQMEEAIVREKQLKKWSRAKKNGLIEMMSGDWKDLSKSLG